METITEGVSKASSGVDVAHRIGVIAATSYIIGNVVGSGIFITPTEILKNTHSVGLSLLVWLISGIASLFGAFCYAELGTIVKQSGADFAYLCHVRWYAMAFAFMSVGCVLNWPCAVAIQAKTFSEYVFQGFGIDIGHTWTYVVKKLIELTLIFLLTFLNFFSLGRFVSKFNIVASIAKLVATAMVIVIGFYTLIFRGQTQNFARPFDDSKFEVGKLVSAFFAGLYSYAGWDILNFGAEEIDNPRRTLPLAIIIGMSTVLGLYMLMNVAYFAVIDVDAMLHSQAVASTFAARSLGGASSIMPVLVCFVMVGSMNTAIFAASRFLHAAAKSGFLPTFMSCTNKATNSPRASLVVHALLAAAMTFVGDISALMDYSGFAQWSQRAATLFVFFVIRYKRRTNQFGTPIFVPAVFLLSCIALVAATLVQQYKVAVISVVILVASALVYFFTLHELGFPSIPGYDAWAKTIDDHLTAFVQRILNASPQRRASVIVRATNIHGPHVHAKTLNGNFTGQRVVRH